jgi:hypothetical protein
MELFNVLEIVSVIGCDAIFVAVATDNHEIGVQRKRLIKGHYLKFSLFITYSTA